MLRLAQVVLDPKLLTHSPPPNFPLKGEGIGRGLAVERKGLVPFEYRQETKCRKLLN